MPTPSSSCTQNTPTSEQVDSDDLATHRHLVSKILEKTGFEARDFQIKAVKAVLDGRDVIVHAGTGSGKTLIFAAPHFVLEKRTSIVISPLILLQHDQQERMRKMGLNAIALNKEVHVEAETWEELAEGKYEIVLLSPEMALHSEDVSKVFKSDAFRNALMAIHVDEAHMISLWGGDFRKDYQGIGRIRACLPKGIPASLVSATLRPNVKQDAMSTLGFPSDPAKYADVSIGNERLNVYIGARPMRYPLSSFKDVLSHFNPNETDPKNIPQTIIYIDDVNDVTLAVIALYDWLHPSLQGQELVMPVHAWMTPKYRSEAMAKFASGEWVPNCVSEGAPNDKGKSAANNKKKAGSKAEPVDDTDKTKYGAKFERKCDRLLQKFVTEPKCRREYLNRVYANPKSGKHSIIAMAFILLVLTLNSIGVVVPPQDCCDLCDPDSAARVPSHKFPIQQGPPKAARVSGESNPNMLSCLRTWRANAFPSAFGLSRMFGSSALISDIELERISRCAPVPSIDRLRSYLVKWPYVDSQLESMWEALKAGGFALPVESPAPIASGSSLVCDSQPTPGPSTLPTAASASKPRRSTRTKSKTTRSKAVKLPTSTQTPAIDTWWRGYSGEQNYEVRQSNMDDIRRILARKPKEEADKQPPQHTRPSKRPRLDSVSTSCPAPLQPAPMYHSTAVFPPTPRISDSMFSAPARPVGRLIVPSQRPLPPVVPPRQPSTAARSDLLVPRNAPVRLVHPLPIRVPIFTFLGISQNRECASSRPAPY
ncbi:DEAD/DEAH box helicase [Ceratobasidium sp. AG-Ba]|nr:DEAD/DEAH box helicase [Ceratobasidium sp. AG-Ba]